MINLDSQLTEAKTQSIVDSANTSVDASNILLAAISVDKQSANRTSFVNVVSELPDLKVNKLADGTTIFVNGINTHAVANNQRWITFDGRLLRNDAPTITAWSWGGNTSGQVGDNTSINKSSPVSVVGGFTDWCQVSVGGNHSTVVRTDGTMWSWGCNANGQLGDNTVVSKSSPVSVVGGFTDWCQVSVGCTHTAAVRTNGTIWSWGNNGNGQLGNDTISTRSSPVSVVGGFTDWCQVSAGGFHTAAVRTNGTIWSWGVNQCGRLGDNTTVNKSSPVSVVGGFTDWCQVSAAAHHTAAVRSNGTLWSWGFNGSGRLGDNSSVSRSSPVSVVGGFTDWCQVSAGSTHTAAVRTNGTVWSWGYNGNGRLGDNTTFNKSSPVSVVGGFTDWCQVSTGQSHAVAVRTNGTIWSWGSSSVGQLGDNTIVDKSSPVSVVGGFTDWCQVSAGGYHTAAIRVTP